MAGCNLRLRLKVLLLFVLLISSKLVSGKPFQDTTIQNTYNATLSELDTLLKQNGSFKDAVFAVENAFLGNQLERNKFYNPIDNIVSLCSTWLEQNSIYNYRYADSANFKKNAALFAILKDTFRIQVSDSQLYIIPPFDYDFEDYAGMQNWSNMFVTKLLITRKGNCHSLPYLYKIVADELGATCWLSLAPNHLYIKNRSKKMGWYNTELTSGTFPIDAWITASGYIPLQAIRSGIYMDTLSNQQAIALCVLDLAKGYEFQTKNYYDGFIIKCCDLVLENHPVNVQATLLKAETLRRVFDEQKANKSDIAATTFQKMEQLYMKLFDLGYREMPNKMYMDWIKSMAGEKEKYSNKQVMEVIKKN